MTALDILTRTADSFGLTVADLRCNPDRRIRVVWARQAAMHLLKTHIPRISLVDIGRIVGNRHHTTVMDALKHVAARRAIHQDYDALIRE